MPLVHYYALCTYMEMRYLCIGVHFDGNVLEFRRAGTVFDGEYLEAHPQVCQAIFHLEMFYKSLHLEKNA